MADKNEAEKVTKKKTTTKNTGAKKTTKKPAKEVEVKNEEVKEFVEAEKVETTVVEEETKTEDTITNLNEKNVNVNQNVKDEIVPVDTTIEEKEVKETKKDNLVDIGILVVIIGLFILIITTYLSFSVDLSYMLTNTGVIIALIVELTGISIVVTNSINKK